MNSFIYYQFVDKKSEKKYIIYGPRFNFSKYFEEGLIQFFESKDFLIGEYIETHFEKNVSLYTNEHFNNKWCIECITFSKNKKKRLFYCNSFKNVFCFYLDLCIKSLKKKGDKKIWIPYINNLVPFEKFEEIVPLFLMDKEKEKEYIEREIILENTLHNSEILNLKEEGVLDEILENIFKKNEKKKVNLKKIFLNPTLSDEESGSDVEESF